jgi:SAM-dependent methyltransferase
VSRTRTAWDEEAQAWIAWARARELDYFFWDFNLPALLELLPPPGRLTVDVACGEGRVARELKARGHRIVGIEGSPALAAAAREADPDFEVHVADAARVPLANASADLAVSSLALLNLDDLDGAVREVARVLSPGGRFCFSIVHPFNSPKPLGDHAEAGSYFAEYGYAEMREREGRRMTFHDIHRPLERYAAALERAGLLIEALREPRPSTAAVAAHPSMERWLTRPCMLHVRALRP